MPEEKSTVPFNFDELALVGRVEDTKEKITGYKIKMHTLNSDENLEVLKRTSVLDDVVAKYDILRRANLIYSIISINDEKLSLEQCEKIVYGLQKATLDVIYEGFEELTAQQQKILDELKKN